MQRLAQFLIRPDVKLADTGFLFLACVVGGGAGAVLASKISLLAGIPFAVFASLTLHLMWRSPVSSGGK